MKPLIRQLAVVFATTCAADVVIGVHTIALTANSTAIAMASIFATYLLLFVGQHWFVEQKRPLFRLLIALSQGCGAMLGTLIVCLAWRSSQ